MLHSPSELDAMSERIHTLEQENQRKAEIISRLLDENGFLQRLVAELGRIAWHSEP